MNSNDQDKEMDALARQGKVERSKRNYPTQAQVLDAVERSMIGTDNPGFCLACGEEADGCEPDARGYECECCGEHQVYGAAEVLMMGAYRS